MSSQNTYKYTPLQRGEIRVLTLHPGEAGDPIRCSLTHFPLRTTTADLIYDRWRKAPTNSGLFLFNWDNYYQEAKEVMRGNPVTPEIAYEAISYVWGAQPSCELIYIGTETIYIRPNLHLALTSLRATSSSRTLWIDALCINQTDVYERNVQVSMMSSIYRNAYGTVIWLGEGNSKSDLAFDALNSGEARAVTEHASSILSLATRPYWRRLWIIQEIYVTKVKARFFKSPLFANPKMEERLFVYCGSKRTPWRVFKQACTNLSVGNIHYSLFGAAEEQSPVRAANQNGNEFRTICDLLEQRSQPLKNLIQYCGSFECQDLRDKIYGVLGMALDAEDFSSLVDYNKNLETVYLDVMNHTFKDRQTFQGINGTASNLMPFSRRLQQLLEQPFWDSSSKSYRLVASKIGTITRETEMIVHNRISFLSPPIQDRLIPESPSPSWQPFGDNLISSFSWQLLCKMLGKWKELLSDDRACQRVVDLQGPSSSAVNQLEKLSLHDANSLDRLDNLRLRIFVTADGDYGLVPMSAEVGDGLCVDSCWSKMDLIALVRPPKGGVKASVIGRAVLLPKRAESYKSEEYELVTMSIEDIQLLTR